MNQSIAFALAGILLLPVAADAKQSPERDETSAAVEEIQAALDALMAVYETGAAEAFAERFGQDAVYVANTGEVLRGRSDIREGVERFVARRERFFELAGLATGAKLRGETRVTRSRIFDETAHTLGRFEVRVEPSGCIMDLGPFLAVWRREEAKWLIDTLLVGQDRNAPEKSCLSPPPAPTASDKQLTRAAPGEKVRVVRFKVKPDGREEFERFFRESLLPAAAARRGVAPEDLDPEGFRLLTPTGADKHGQYTYYILQDPIDFELGSGQVMRDLVRAAFPGEEGERRIARWMTSIVVEEPFQPVAENLVEAELKPDGDAEE